MTKAFPINKTVKEITSEIRDSGGATIADKLALSLLSLVDNPDPKSKAAGIKLGIDLFNTFGPNEESSHDHPLIDPAHAARDIRIIHTAVNNGWNIPHEIMATLPAAIAHIALHGSPRNRIAAGRLLVAMHGQNVRAAPRDRTVTHVHELGPITETNLEEHRQRLLKRIDCLSANAGGVSATSSVD